MCVKMRVFLFCFKAWFSASETIFKFRKGGRAKEM